MKVVSSPDMRQAMRAMLERVPLLQTDTRPEALRSVAKNLAKTGLQGAYELARADVATLRDLRFEVLKDMFETGKASTVGTPGAPPPAAKETSLVAGGSVSGLAAAIALAKSGQHVMLIEPRPEHVRDIRWGSRQGMIDTLCMLDPKLAMEFVEKTSQLESIKVIDARDLGKKPEDFTPKSHAPDANQVPVDGAALMKTTSTQIAVARLFEQLVDDHVKKNFGGSIEYVQGKLHGERQTDGNMKWALETPGKTKNDPPVLTDFLKGVKPKVIIVAEGSSSPTRLALGIKSEATTPTQWWTAGVIHTTDQTVQTKGKATIRELYDEQVVKQTDGTSQTQTQRAVAISDGVAGTWVLTQMPPGWDANPSHPQQDVNDYYFKRAALVTGAKEDDLRAAGATGPFAVPNSQPTVFALQGKSANRAAEVTPDGTVIGLLGDAAATSTFQAGGGMNTAVTEVMSVMTLMEDLQSGVSSQTAAAHYERSVFNRGGAWSAAGIEYFYPKMPESEVQRLVTAEMKAIADWRKDGGTGATPLQRLQAILEKNPLSTEPVGLKLAA